MNWYDKFIVPIWVEYKLVGFLVIVAVLVALILIFGIDVREWIERWLWPAIAKSPNNYGG